MKQIVIGIGAALVVAYVAILVFGGGPSVQQPTGPVEPTPVKGHPVENPPRATDPLAGAAELKQTQLKASCGQFNLRAGITLKNDKALARVLVNADAEGKNGYAVDLAPTAARLVRIEHGIEQELARTDELSLGTDTPHELLIKRRRLPLTVVIDDRVVLRVEDDSFSSGTVTVGGTGVELASPAVQLTEEIYKTEDFMATAEEGAATWTPVTGTWQVHSVDHPVLSANPFSYRVTGAGENTTVVGYPFWDDYRYEASFNAPKAAAVGLYFYYRSDGTGTDADPSYYLLSWDSNTVENPKVRLVKVEHGKQSIVREAPGGFIPDQWYRMTVRVLGTTAEVYISDRKIFDQPVVDPSLVGGKVGLYARDAELCFFDDVYIRSIQSVDGLEATRPGQWTSIGKGTWTRQATADDSPALACTSPDGDAIVVRGGLHWKNYTVEADITPGRSSTTGIGFGYQNPINLYRVDIDNTVTPRKLSLVRVRNGRAVELDDSPIDLPESDSYRLTVRTRGDYLGVLLEGRTVLDVYEPGYRGGKVALMCKGSTEQAPTVFENLAIRFSNERAPKLAASESHQAEVTMSVWNRDWQELENMPQGMSAAYIHKQDFPGNEKTIEAQVTALPDETSAVGLSLCGTPGGFQRSYWMLLHGGPEWKVELHRAGQIIRTFNVTAEQRTRMMSLFAEDPRVKGKGFMMKLTRIGKGYLLAYLENQCLGWVRDPEPLEGVRPGYFTMGKALVNDEKVNVDSPLTFNDSFRQATTDWRVQTGIWEVTNRWQCDPRWSFFSGRPNAEALAAIWHKRSFGGDLSVDFYVGPMMLRDTLGDYNNYIRDFNVTLCADGKDLSSGYTFSLGSVIDGKRNAGSRIIRRGSVIAENTTSPWARIAPRKEKLATRSLHRQWFHVQARMIRLETGGARLELWVDGHKVCEATDDDPLPGKRVAIWTCNCGIMVARVRVSSTEPGAMEPYDFEPSDRCEHFYSGEKLLKVKWTNPRKNN